MYIVVQIFSSELTHQSKSAFNEKNYWPWSPYWEHENICTVWFYENWKLLSFIFLIRLTTYIILSIFLLGGFGQFQGPSDNYMSFDIFEVN